MIYKKFRNFYKNIIKFKLKKAIKFIIISYIYFR